MISYKTLSGTWHRYVITCKTISRIWHCTSFM
ncbi:hypothetical protein F383_27878 [Gossypium arboreum]|uniref:Uncharacterized protein n=1 Tax=Gossypium arboreum TaxID=29729 RepID=A0A0B0P7E6_GOSAR|nr:hypothetical protein F383_27878 [Gossypium arboreum]